MTSPPPKPTSRKSGIGLLIWVVVVPLGIMLGAWLESQDALSVFLVLAVAFFAFRLWQLRARLTAAEDTLAELLAWKERHANAGEVASPVVSPQSSVVSSTEIAPALAIKQAVASEPASPQRGALRPLVPPPSETPTESTFQPPEPQPSLLERGLHAIKLWFTEGNVPVKVGVLVLFAGVAAALRFAAAEGYLTLPIGLRLSLISAAALIGLGVGWRERERRTVFGLSLQGGALGVLLLTVFAAFRLYGLLPAPLAFAFVVVLVAGAALLAVLQEAMALAVLGFLGGYLAPVLISTGSGNHVALFSYYAVLNVAVLAISWWQHWRVLNLIGFAFTFGIGSLWFSRSYRPDMFWTVEPFLILFFLFYVLIGLLYVVRRDASHPRDGRRPWLDGSLVFGTPLVAFPMQAVLLRDKPMALAFSAIVVAGLYLALLFWLRQRRGERLLTEAYAALAMGFATLAVPLAFSAGTTASLWALEGAAVAWMGLRQKRTLPWLAGLTLQLLAAGAYLISEIHRLGRHEWLLANGTWLGAAMLGFAGMALALIHDRHKPVPLLPAALMLWGLGWWTAAGLTQISEAGRHFGNDGAQWHFTMAYLSVSLLAAGGLRRRLRWPRAGWGMALGSSLAVLCVPWAHDEFASVLAVPTLPAWTGYFVAWLIALRLNREGPGRSVALTHGLGLWTFLFAATWQIAWHMKWVLDEGSGWTFLAITAPLALLTLGLWRRPEWLAWPRAEAFETGYRALWFGWALLLLALGWLSGLFDPGNAEPLPYVPLINPLELGLIGIALLLWGYCRDRLPKIAAVAPLWVGAAFAFVSMATLRAVHHFHGESWSPGLLNSGFAHTSLTVVWSLLGVMAWIAGSRLHRRPLWLAGAGLMGVVLLKLIVIDRQYMGNIPGIVSFLAVGLLLVGVGYFAPSPPKTQEPDIDEANTEESD